VSGFRYRRERRCGGPDQWPRRPLPELTRARPARQREAAGVGAEIMGLCGPAEPRA
jgi:hypothetical protein